MTRGPLSMDALHVINLDRRPQRMQRFINRVRLEQDWSVPIVRHQAVDTATWVIHPSEREVSLANFVDTAALTSIARGFRYEEHEVSRGAVGCTLSHMALWSYMLARPDLEYLWVFEDDAVWAMQTHLSPTEVIEMLQTHIPNDWDILSLGSQHIEVAVKNEFYSELSRYWATHAYILHRDALSKLMVDMLPISKQLDAALSEKTVTHGLKVVSPNRVMYWQHSPDTDVQVPLHLPDGTVRHVDGTYVDPSGVRRLEDGTIIEP